MHCENIKKIIEEIVELINKQEFIEKHRATPKCFERKSKLSCTDIISIILSKSNKALNTVIQNFTEKRYPNENMNITKQAFSSARKKILPSAIYEIMQLSAKEHDHPEIAKLWNGHNIKAIDGSTLRLPNTEENYEKYSGQKNQYGKYAMAKISAVYDISRDIIEDVIIDRYNDSERKQAIRLNIDNTPNHKGKLPIVLLDRGYPSKEIIENFHDKNILYVMRCPKAFLKCVNEAPQGESKTCFNYKNKIYPLRIIKHILSGEEKIIITNLLDEQYKARDIIDLYFRRWSIEVKYKEVKITLKAENFSGIKPIAIEQDFYATIFITNIISAFKKESDKMIEEIDKRKELKYQYQTNRNFIAGKILENIEFFFSQSPEWIDEHCMKILNSIKKERSPIRPNRTNPRSFKSVEKVSTYPQNLRSSS